MNVINKQTNLVINQLISRLFTNTNYDLSSTGLLIFEEKKENEEKKR